MIENATVLVTGATGFIGTQLVQQLTSRGFRVKALCRQSKLTSIPGSRRPHPLSHPLVSRVRGDVTDRDSIDAAMAGCDYLFHVAGLARQWESDPSVYYQVNAEGVRNVLESARLHSLQKAVVTSTIVTFGPTEPGQIGNEGMQRNTDHYHTEYEKSKADGEAIALEFAGKGLPVVIVNPTRVYGPGYLNEGNSVSRLIDEYDRGRFPILLNRGRNQGNYVFVDDVVQGHLLAMEKGRPGHRYILGGENASLKNFFQLVDDVSGKQHLQISMSLTPRIVAWAHEKRARWLGVYPQITPGWLRTFMTDWVFESEKAKTELGYQPQNLVNGITRTYQWLLDVRLRHGTRSATQAEPENGLGEREFRNTVH